MVERPIAVYVGFLERCRRKARCFLHLTVAEYILP
jgi:hypothetical protein